MRQEKDEYVKRAKVEGSPSRAIFKLDEIFTRINNESNNQRGKRSKEAKTKFLRKGDIVVDLGVSLNLAFVDC